MLKIKIIPVLLFFFCLTSCSSITSKDKTKSTPTSPVKDAAVTTFFELAKPQKLILLFKSVDSGEEIFLSLNSSITKKVFPEGYWELIGFEFEGKSFESINARKKFVLRVKNNQITYGGSVILGCPRVGEDQNALLKDMAFFDRYSFSSKKTLCELIIGNRLESLKSGLDFSNKSSKLKFEAGF